MDDKQWRSWSSGFIRSQLTRIFSFQKLVYNFWKGYADHKFIRVEYGISLSNERTCISYKQNSLLIWTCGAVCPIPILVANISSNAVTLTVSDQSWWLPWWQSEHWPTNMSTCGLNCQYYGNSILFVACDVSLAWLMLFIFSRMTQKTREKLHYGKTCL